MRTTVTALTCAVAFAAAFGVVSAATRKSATDHTNTTAHEDAATTMNGCLQLNAFDQYVLVTGERQYRLLLQTDADLTQDVGKPVQVTGRLLQHPTARTSQAHAAEKPVATTGHAADDAGRSNAPNNSGVFGVVAARATTGNCSAQTAGR